MHWTQAFKFLRLQKNLRKSIMFRPPGAAVPNIELDFFFFFKDGVGQPFLKLFLELLYHYYTPLLLNCTATIGRLVQLLLLLLVLIAQLVVLLLVLLLLAQ